MKKCTALKVVFKTYNQGQPMLPPNLEELIGANHPVGVSPLQGLLHLQDFCLPAGILLWFPKDIQEILEQIRSTVKEAAPGSEETIKYAMPTFTLNGNLVHFAAFKNHIGFILHLQQMKHLKKNFPFTKQEKVPVQFPINKPIPLNLITAIVLFQLKKNFEKAKKEK